MRSNRGDIAFTEDILQEVSNRLGKDYKKVEYVYNVFTDYLKYVITETDAVSISFPFIGHYHIKTKDIKRELKKAISKEDEEKEAIFKSKYDKLRKYYRGYYKYQPPQKSLHDKHRRYMMYKYNGGKSMVEIEGLQNSIADEAKK